MTWKHKISLLYTRSVPAALLLGSLGACDGAPEQASDSTVGTLPVIQQPVLPGIDVLMQRADSLLEGKRVGLITNQTSVNREGIPSRQVLHADPRVNLVALYTPEHGLDGKQKAGRHVGSRIDEMTGLTAHSLYGPTRKPTAVMLQGIDILVFDLQDIGTRSYTYISTMILAMEAAGENNLQFMVLDRPNPLGGQRIDGPPMESQWISFIGQLPVPYVHGMTAGEIAKMANEKGWNAQRCDLIVVPMLGWQRNMNWQATGLTWVPTSPNIPHPQSTRYYAASGIFGSLSGGDIGIGTLNPFEYVAASGVNSVDLTRHLNSLQLPGVMFTPYESRVRDGYAGSRIHILANAETDLAGLNLIFIDVINRWGGVQNLFAQTSGPGLATFYKAYGSDGLQHALDNRSPAEIISSWQDGQDQFRKERQPFLIYQ